MKIFYKLSLSFLAIAVLIAFVGNYAAYESEKALERNIGETSAILARKLIGKIDVHMQNWIERFQVFQSTSAVHGRLRESAQEFERLPDIEEYINKTDEEWVAVPAKAVTPFMQKLLDDPLSQELREIIDFYHGKYSYRAIGEWFITNRYGANVAMSGKTTDYRQNDEPWWRQAVRDGVFVGDLAYDASADVYSIDIGVRIAGRAEDPLGAAKVVLNVEEIINFLKEAQAIDLPDQFRPEAFTLMDARGRMLYSTSDFTVFEEGWDRLPEGLLRDDSARADGAFTRGTGKEAVLGVYACSRGYRDFPGSGWIVLLEHRAEKLYAPSRRLRNQIALVAACVAALGIVIGGIVSGSLSRRLGRLRSTATALREGDFARRAKVKGRDEIGALGESINTMAERLEEYYHHLEDMVAKRTEMLQKANEELRARDEELKSSQSALVESERIAAIARLAEGFSREINNPLSVVTNNLAVIRRDFHSIIDICKLYREAASEEDREEHRKLLLAARGEQENADYIITAIDRILDSSDETAKRIRTIVANISEFTAPVGAKWEEVNVNDTLQTTLAVLAHELKTRNIQVEQSYAELPELYGMPGRLSQLFYNILTNAIEALPKGGGIAVVTEADAGAITVAISDNGPGVPKTCLDKIFEPFFTTKPGRSGLGLSVSRRIVADHSGELEVTSEEGGGAAFRVTLPLRTEKKLPEENSGDS